VELLFMSLVGNLEDLGLGEILQIVSLSRKSGVLSLDSSGRTGKVTFLNGQVIRATTSASRVNLGDLLVRRELVDVDTLKKALFLQRNSENPPRLGVILAEKFNVPSEKIEEVAKEQIEKIVYSFFTWNEGSFSFDLGETSVLASGSLNPLQFMLDSGLNPQWLAMEGSRILDEKVHKGDSLEPDDEGPVLDIVDLLGKEGAAELERAAASSAAAAAPQVKVAEEPALTPAFVGKTVYLVDDDQLTAQVVARRLREQRLDVKVFTSAKDFIGAVVKAVAAQELPLLLVDLIMPKCDGTGILGGVEIIQKVKSEFKDLTLLLMSDHPTPEVEQKLARFKLPALIPKPRKNELNEDASLQMLTALAETVFSFAAPGLSSVVEDPEVDTGYHFGAELLKEVNDAELQARPGKIQPTPGIHLLGGMLQELNNPSLGGGIILLVLRFASELMNRAVIFFVKGDEITGLGQFGIETTEVSADVLIRKIKLPVQAQSILSESAKNLTPAHIKFGDGEWDRYLIDKLGGQKPVDAFVGPIISEGSVVAFIYGDNLPKQEAVGDTESFEIFLSQAGMAMEKALLERRLKGSQAV
jgi:CheY-like chemotaxis protein